MRGNYGLFGPWETWRKVSLALSIVIGLAMVPLANAPVGLVALVLFVFFLMPLWKNTTDDIAQDKGKTPYTPGTRAFKVAMFFESARMNKSDVLDPKVVLGFGPPREDFDHGIESAGWFPATRMSAMWCAFVALLISTLDIVTHMVMFPVWGFTLPWLITMPVSAVGWFVILQFITDIGRIRASADGGLQGNEPAPAVMVNKVNWKDSYIPPALQSSVWSILIFIPLLVAKLLIGFSFLIVPALTVLLFVVVFLAMLCRGVTDDYRVKWQEREDERETFENAWMHMGDGAPTFMDSEYWPSEEDWYADPRFCGENQDEPYAPKIKITRCVFADGKLMEDYFGKEEQVVASFSATEMVFVPFPERSADGREIPGTAGPLGFSMWATEDNNRYDVDAIFDDDTDKIEKDFAIRQNVLKSLREIKQIGRCYLVSFSLLSRPKGMLKDPENNRSLTEIKIRPADPLVSINDFRDPKVIEALKAHLQVDYVRAHKDARSEGNVVTLLVGDLPYSNIEFRRPPAIVMKMIRDADFSHIFQVNKLSSASGTPKLRDFQTIGVVEEQEFSLPEGMSFDDVQKMQKSIMENTGNAFMEIKKGPSEALKKKKTVRRRAVVGKKDDTNQNETVFSITSAKENPLNRMFKFMDYKDQILPGRTPGQARLEWHPGVKSNDTLASDDFESDIPHLLIAGSSGSGKHGHVDTPIYTRNRGWIRLGDVVAGDVVLDGSGTFCSVTDAFRPVELSDHYEVVLSTGETLKVSGTHMWTVHPVDGPVLVAGDVDVDDVARTADRWVHGATDGSAWFRGEDGNPVEATSWIDVGAMEETNPHVSSRIAQSAIRGIHPVVWGWLFTRFSDARDVSNITAGDVPSVVADVLSAGGHNVTDMGLPDSLSTLIAMAWEDDNTTRGMVRDVIDTLGWDVDLVSGVAMSLDGVDRADWSNAAVEALTLFEVAAEDVDSLSLKTMGRRDSLVADAVARRMESDNYVCGVRDGLPSSGGFTVIWDASIRYHLLTHGVVVPSVRNAGVESIPLPETEFHPEHPVAYLRGYNAQIGIVSDELSVRAPVVCSRVREVVQSTGLAYLDGDTVVSAMTAMSSRSADHLDSDFVHDLYDRDGDRVVSVVDAVQLTGLDIPTIIPVLADCHVTGVFRTPVLQKFASGNKAKVSGEWDLFRMADMYGNRNGRKVHPGTVLTTDRVPVGSVIFRGSQGVLGRGMDMSVDPVVAGVGLSGVRNDSAMGMIGAVKSGWLTGSRWLVDGVPVGRFLADSDCDGVLPDGWELSSVEWRQRAIDAYEQAGGDLDDPVYRSLVGSVTHMITVEDVREVHTESPEQFRCISVGSMSRTYQLGRTFVPTHNSVVVQNMICQMIYNNDPQDLRMWLLEPKIGLGRFRYYDTCERFVDSWYPTDNFFENVQEWAHDLVEEMLRRNNLLSHHIDPDTMMSPEKLAEGREIAQNEGIEQDDGTTHELWIPYILAYIEECGTVFADSADKEQKAIQSGILVDIARIARESRSAGIFLICLTQYPTNASIPSVIRNQMRRVGLKCQNSLASRICIEQDGLEDLFIKGSGMVQGNGGVFEQFRGFLLEGGDPKKGEANDILDCLATVPNSFRDNPDDPSHTQDNQNPYVDAAEMDNTIFNLWRSTTGYQLDKAIDEQKETKAAVSEGQMDKMFPVKTP